MTVADHGDVAASPAEALGEVWEVLDSLPRAATSPDLLATTVEMAAVSVPSTGPQGGGSSPARFRLTAVAVVLASLVAGLALGRATAPRAESVTLANLPIVQHVDLLRQLGSVGFLEEVARRDYSGPRRQPPTRSPEEVRADDEAFDAAIAALGSLDSAGPDAATLAERRQEVLALPETARRQLEKSAERFSRLSAADRRDMIALGRALGDPARGELVEAARLWHRWVQLRDPADRQDVVDLSTADRLECLDRWTRFDMRDMPRGDVREGMRQWFERDMRRPPNFRPPGPGGSPGEFRPGDSRPGEFRPGEFRPGGGPGFRPGGPGSRAGQPEMRPGEPRPNEPPRGERPPREQAPGDKPPGEPGLKSGQTSQSGQASTSETDVSAPGTKTPPETRAPPR